MPKKVNGQYEWMDRIYLGKSTFRDDFMPRDIFVKTDIHLQSIGMSGSGKSGFAIWPNLGMYAGAAFVVDLKREHRAVTENRRSGLGLTYNMDGLGLTGEPTDYYNPFDEVDTSTPEGIELLREITQAIVIPERGSQEGHFSDSADTIFLEVCTQVCDTMPPQHRNLGTVYDLLMSIDPESDPDVWDDLVADMSQNPVGGGVCIQAAKLMLDVGDNEGGSFKSTISKSIKWLTHPGMREHLSYSDLSMKELATQGPRKPTVYCPAPTNATSC